MGCGLHSELQVNSDYNENLPQNNKSNNKNRRREIYKISETSKDNKIISCTPKLSRCFISWRQRNGLLFITLYGTQLIFSFFICSRCLQSQISSFLLWFVPTLVYGPSENFARNREAVLPLGSSASGQLGNKPTLNSHSWISVNQLFNKGLPQPAPVLHRGSAFLRRAWRTTKVS